MTQDIQLAGQLAQKLENQNQKRRQITRETLDKAEDLVTQQDTDGYLIFVADPDFKGAITDLKQVTVEAGVNFIVNEEILFQSFPFIGHYIRLHPTKLLPL